MRNFSYTSDLALEKYTESEQYKSLREKESAIKKHRMNGIDENIYGMAKESTGSNVGTGGMATKLAAAKIATLSGTDMIIANGGDVRILQDIFENDYVGTLFTANENANFNLANYIMETIG